MDPKELAQFIDHAMLRADARQDDYVRACEQALAYEFRGLVVPSGAVALAKRRLMDTGIKVIATVAFPHGTAAPDVKAAEASRASAMGADEIDYVISIGAALDEDYKFLREEAIAIQRGTRGKLLKGILEVGYLSEKQIFNAASTLADCGVHYVKTCTGFGPGLASQETVGLLCRAVKGKALVKASGGIRERWQAIQMLSAGAAVIGTSHGPQMCSEDG